MATRARISVQAVSALERGARHAPRGDTLALLTQALELHGEALSEFEAAAHASVKPKIRTTQPLHKTDGRKHTHLPQFGNSFFGRERETRDLAAAVTRGGCTTLWGTGGVGKTRLAVETSALVEDCFERTAFVGLAPISGDEAVEDAIASALGVAREPGADLLARIVSELSQCRCLVIVDNCEHVVAGAARAVGALTAALPDVAFICTSREPLRFTGERVMTVGALDAVDAQRLFVDRAATSAPDEVLSAADARDVTTICRKLDGIPLALELAAACARVLDLEHVASGLDERFRLLTRGSRAASDRHTTLRATIAWSYDLLSSSERHVFERAGVINGSFSLDDLLSISTEEACDRASALAATATLCDKSLLVVEIDGATSRRRYHLLESTRAFALDALGAGDNGSMLMQAHRRWGRLLAQRLRQSVEGYRQGASSPLGDVRLDQIRGYLDWAIGKRQDVAAGTKLAGEIHLVWDFCGLHLDAIRRIEAGLALLSDGDADAYAAMAGWYAVARLNQRLVRVAESLAPALRAYELAVRVGDDAIRASSAAKLAVAYDVSGERPEALAYAKEAIAMFDRVGDIRSAAFATCTAGVIACKIRGDQTAIETLRSAVERLRMLGDPRRTAGAELDLGEAYFASGDVEAAITTAEAAVTQFRKTNSHFELGLGLTNLGAYLTGSGRAAEAKPLAREALEIGREGRHTRVVALAAQTCATIAALEARERRPCVQLFGYVARRYETIGEIGYTEAAAHEHVRCLVDGLLLAGDYAEAIRTGEAFDDEAAIDTALQCVGSQHDASM